MKTSLGLKAVASLLLLALLFSGTCFAQAQNGLVFLDTDNGEWKGIMVAVTLIMLILAALAVMFSRFLSMPQLEVWAKEEFYQALAGLVLVGLTLMAITAVELQSIEWAKHIMRCDSSDFDEGCSSTTTTLPWRYHEATGTWDDGGKELYCGAGLIAPSSVYSQSSDWGYKNEPCHFYLGRAWLGSTYEKAWSTLKGIANLYGWVGLLQATGAGASSKEDKESVPDNANTPSDGGAGYNLYGPVLAMDFGFAPFTGSSVLMNSMTTVGSMLIKVMIVVKFQEISLLYMEKGVYPLFLMGGFVLRTVWFTRKLGGLMIAIALGIFFILPFMYALGWYTMDTPALVGAVDSGGDLSPMANQDTDPEKVFDKAKGGLVEMYQPEKMFFTKYNSDGSIDGAPGLLDITSRFIVAGFAVPLLCFFVFIGFVKGMSPFFGGDVEIAGITRLL